jgi:hypothetical protein
MLKVLYCIFTLLLFSTNVLSADKNWWNENSCVRAEPVAALKKTTPQHTFKLELALGLATETAVIKGHLITIIHSGCENLTWEISLPLTAEQNLPAAEILKRARTLLNDVKPQVEFLYGVDEAIGFIKSHKKPELKFDEFYDLDKNEIGTSLEITVKANPRILTVTLSHGPL